MRRWYPVLGLALAFQAHGYYDGMREEPTPIAEAVAVKCDRFAEDMREDCTSRYQDEFASGALDPMAVLRTHCTRFTSEWEEGGGEPPAVCHEQFGGWLES